MKNYIDEQNDLIWQGYNIACDGKYKLPIDDCLDFDKVIDELNTWHSSNIEEYIVRGELLGNFLQDFHETMPYGDHYLYVASNDQGVVAATYISSKQFLVPKYALEKMVEQMQNPVGSEYITFNDAKVILQKNNNENAVDFNYVIVNPEFQHMGFGKKVVDSIVKNLTFFANTNDVSTLVAYVNEKNIPSIKAMISAGLKKFNPGTYINMDGYNMFLAVPDSNNKENVKEEIGDVNTQQSER